MKKVLKKRTDLIWILMICAVTACQHQQSNAASEKMDVHLDFDTAFFFHQADSLISEIHHQHIHLTAEMSIDKNDSAHVMINMDPGKGNRIMRISMDQYTYDDTTKLQNKFEELRAEGRDISNEEEVPGLTYNNDFVFRTNKHIYWINSPCHYAFFNHNKLKQYFIESVFDKAIRDSIVCQCGGSCY